MGYYSTANRFDIGELDLGSRASKKQAKRIESLTQVSDFTAADFDRQENKITFRYWEDYDRFVAFLKKLVAIKPDIYTQITVEDTNTEEYWTIEIIGSTIEECFGVVVWGNEEDRLKIKNVLEAHLETSPEKLEEITTQIIMSLKGAYDNDEQDGEEPTDEELEQIGAEETDDSAGANENDKNNNTTRPGFAK